MVASVSGAIGDPGVAVDVAAVDSELFARTGTALVITGGGSKFPCGKLIAACGVCSGACVTASGCGSSCCGWTESSCDNDCEGGSGTGGFEGFGA